MATVLVTGAGGAAVPWLIGHLQKHWGHRVIAVDCDEHAAGLRIADNAFVVPRGDDPEFVPVLRRLCEASGVDAMVPLVDEELLPAFECGVPVLLPQRPFVATCLDKFTLMRELAGADIAVPCTWEVGDVTVDAPMVLKPRHGRGSRHVSVVKTDAEVQRVMIRAELMPEDMLLQERLEGTEYTVSVVCWRDGRVHAVVPKRIIVKRGITLEAVTERNAAIDKLCRRIQSALHADGPFNVQLSLTANGPKVFEINPRFSGTVSLTTAAGVDEVGGLVALACGEKYTFGAPVWNMRMRRRWHDSFTLAAYGQAAWKPEVAT